MEDLSNGQKIGKNSNFRKFKNMKNMKNETAQEKIKQIENNLNGGKNYNN